MNEIADGHAFGKQVPLSQFKYARNRFLRFGVIGGAMLGQAFLFRPLRERFPRRIFGAVDASALNGLPDEWLRVGSEIDVHGPTISVCKFLATAWVVHCRRDGPELQLAKEAAGD